MAAYAMRENHYAVFVFTYEISQVSKLQDKHNGFLLYFFKDERSCFNPFAKMVFVVISSKQCDERGVSFMESRPADVMRFVGQGGQ